MTTWARLNAGVVIEVTTLDPAGRFNSAIIWTVVPDGTVPNAVQNADGSFTAPPPPAAVPTPAVQAPVVAVSAFLLLFTVAEMAAIRASTDPDVLAFWSVISDTRTTTVNLGGVTVQSGVNLLGTKGLLAAGRPAQILADQAPPSS